MLIINSPTKRIEFIPERWWYRFYKFKIKLCEIWGFHGGDWLVTQCNVVTGNVCILPQHYMASKLKRSRLEPKIHLVQEEEQLTLFNNRTNVNQ